MQARRGAASVLAMALALASCQRERPSVERAPQPVGAAEVERYLAGLRTRTQALDQSIADLEGRASGSDSASNAAYRSALDELRAGRREIQQELDSLHTETTGSFERATRETDAAVERLVQKTAGLRLRLARDPGELRAEAERQLDALDRHLARLRAGGGADSSGTPDTLQRSRDAVGARLGRLGEPTGEAFEAARRELADAFAEANAHLAAAGRRADTATQRAR